MTSIFSLLSSFVNKYFTDHGLAFAAKKVLGISLVTTVLPQVLISIIKWFFSSVAAVIIHYLPEDFAVRALNYSGVTAYLMELLQVPEIVTVVILAFFIRFIIVFIPTVG